MHVHAAARKRYQKKKNFSRARDGEFLSDKKDWGIGILLIKTLNLNRCKSNHFFARFCC